MKIIKIAQCYFCPYVSLGNSTEVQDIGWCKKKEQTLRGTLIEKEKDIFIQVIPDWCKLEEEKEGENWNPSMLGTKGKDI